MKKNKKTIVITLAAGVLIIGSIVIARREAEIRDSIPVTIPELVVPPPVTMVPSYHAIVIKTTKPGAEIREVVGAKNLSHVLALNRLDVFHIKQGATIIIPDILDDWNVLSPFPKEIPVAADIPKLLLVSQRIQAFAAYEEGQLARWGPVSTGKFETQTPNKLYSTNWKGKKVISTLEGGYILPWAFNLDNFEGIALHQFDLPGVPASHACIRLLEEDAKWIYEWADQWILSYDGQTKLASGTPVIVFGQYEFGKTAPWKNLPTDLNATTITASELVDIISPELDTINARAQQREKILSNRNL